jgi:hypothetical protein
MVPRPPLQPPPLLLLLLLLAASLTPLLPARISVCLQPAASQQIPGAPRTCKKQQQQQQQQAEDLHISLVSRQHQQQ